MALSVALCLIMNINIGSIAQRVREAFRRPRGPPATASFANSTSLARVSLLVRVALIFRLLPSDVGLWIQSPALASVTANPIFTLDQVREAAAIRRLTAPHKFANSYAGRQTHLPVLLLACLEPLTDAITSEYWQHILTGLLLLVVDFIIARLLMQLGEAIVRLSAKHGGREASLQRKMPKVIRPALSHIFPISKTSTDTANGPLLWMLDLPGVAAHLYFASPVTALSSGAFDCFQNVRVMLILYAIVKSYTSVQENGSCVAIAFALALAVYVDVHSVAFVVPAALFLYAKRGRPATMLLLQLFVVLSVCLQGLSLLLVGSADYASIISTTHGHAFTLTGVAPSLSVLWYIAMEMFERFTGYFTILLGGLPYLLIAPASVRLYRYPAELATIFWLLWTICKPICTLYDLNVGLCLLLLCPRSLARMSTVRSLISLCAIAVPVLLYIVMYGLWLETGSGEANFLFFQCLAYNAFLGNILVEFCGACVRRDKALRITEKQQMAKKEASPENKVAAPVPTSSFRLEI